jgi:hypothetical protein
MANRWRSHSAGGIRLEQGRRSPAFLDKTWQTS